MRVGDLLKELQARDETAEVLVMHQDSNTESPSSLSKQRMRPSC